MSGWIKLSKEINTHWIWKDPIKFQWWIDILLTVNYSDTKVPIGFKVFDCKRGETLMSLITWSKRWNVSKSVVYNFFTMLEMDNMIKTVNETVTTRLIVCNYDSYQQIENANETQTKRKRNARRTQHDTIKEEEEEQEEIRIKKEEQIESCFSFDDFWLMYKKSSDKEKCKEKYSKLSEKERSDIKFKLPLYLKTITDKKYQKNPLTYLNGKCWNDFEEFKTEPEILTIEHFNKEWRELFALNLRDDIYKERNRELRKKYKDVLEEHEKNKKTH